MNWPSAGTSAQYAKGRCATFSDARTVGATAEISNKLSMVVNRPTRACSGLRRPLRLTANLIILYKCLLFLLCRAATGPVSDLGARSQQLPGADNATAILRCKVGNEPALAHPTWPIPAPHRRIIQGLYKDHTRTMRQGSV